MPWVYLLRCRDGSLYAGAAQDLPRRLARHAAGRASRYTRARLPVTLAYARRLPSWGQALREEYRLKQLPRAEKQRLARAWPPAPEGDRRAWLAFGRLLPAVFEERPNRFLVRATAEGRSVLAACGDPGRLRELLVPGAALLLAPAAGPGRRTAFDAVLVRQGRCWVSLVPGLANRLFEQALAGGRAPGLRGARVVGREVAHGASRFDFLVRHRGRLVLAEVKSVGLVAGGRALFPDAPTARGTRHVLELAARARRGEAALVAFVVQRAGARSVSPCAEIDPAFAAALAEAARAGVRLLAFGCRVSPRGAAIVRGLPVRLAPQGAG